MSKIWKYNKTFLRKLKKINNYNFEQFKKDIEMFLIDETNSKFKKHKLSGFEDVFSIKLGYNLRALYIFVRDKKNGNIEYLFFDIGNHDEVY